MTAVMHAGEEHGDSGGTDNEQACALWAEGSHSWHKSWSEAVTPHH